LISSACDSSIRCDSFLIASLLLCVRTSAVISSAWL
jgi:hypothetical protein